MPNSWRGYILRNLFTQHNIFSQKDISNMSAYQFGVLDGNSMEEISNIFCDYDDWGGIPHKNFEHGESRAHKEITDKYEIKMTKIYEGGQGVPHLQTVWIVDEIKNEN